ncbi:uncharacterized protein LOC144641257 isoform X2 [Oculina patagonica]
MFKLHKVKKVINTATHNNRDSPQASDTTPHRPGKPRDLILTNILEEGSSVDEPRSFEQDEQYLDECLKVLDGNPEELQVEECDIEEYDFDDYNSVASTASLLNIHAELAQEENNAATRNQSQLPHTLPANQNSTLKAFQPKSTVKKETVINGTQLPNSPSLPPQLREQLLRISKVEASISKVKNWGKYSNGALNTDEWREIFLDAAQAGDLRRLQEAYSKLGGTSEIVIRITDSSANTALHKAAQAGNLQCLRWLVERLPNDCLRNIINQDHHTPLAVAIKYGNVQCVQWLLDHTSATEEMSNNAGRFALIQLTIQNGKDDCLKCLLSYISAKYLELDVADSAGVTLAHVAAREGHMTCLQTLVDHNIDVTTEDKDGRSPADYAYAAGQTGCARYLVMEESCWLLSQRVAKLHRELKDCKEENKDLKQRLEILESRARSGMPDRPEAVGGDQSDTSTGATKTTDDRLGTKLTDSPHSDRSRASGSPDGESPKGFGQERTAYQYHINGSDHSPEHRPLHNRRLNTNGITVVNKESEVKSARQFEALKQQRRLGARGSIDSGGSGVSSPMSWSDTGGENSATQQVMAKQIAANTRRLVMSKHAQKVEESPLIKTKLTPVRVDGLSVDEPRIKGPSLKTLRVDSYHSASSSRSHSPARTDSTSGSRPTSGTPREDLNEINKIKINNARDEKRTVGEDRAGTPSRLRSHANRRKKTSFSSDSTLSSDSDIERSGQRTSGPRHRRGHTSSSRTKEHNINTTGSRQILHRQSPTGGNRTKKTVSWNESPRETNTTNENRQIPNERPRIPPKPPARTTSRGSGVAGYVQVNRNTASRNGIHRNVERGVVPSVEVQKPVNPIAEQPGTGVLSYSLDGYQQDDRPWYETDDFE